MLLACAVTFLLLIVYTLSLKTSYSRLLSLPRSGFKQPLSVGTDSVSKFFGLNGEDLVWEAIKRDARLG